MRHLFRQISALLLCTALFFLTSCGGKEEIKALSYDLSEKPQTIDPQFASGSSAYTIIENAFEGLTRLDDAGEPFGACAERWEVSLDGLTYTFHLREGLVWSDGSPLTAQDFAFALRRLFGSTPAPGAADFAVIRNADEILAGKLPASSLGVQAPDDRTLVVSLAAPHRSFPSLMARPAAMPCQEAFFLEQKGRYGLSSGQVLGNGPFVVESWTDSSVVLARNDAFRTPLQVDRVTLHLGRGDAVSLFLAGKSDGVLAAFRRLPELGGNTGTMSYDQSWVLLFNTSDGSCADPEVRRALVSALDLDALSALLPTGALPSHGIIPPSAALSELPYRRLAGATRPAAAAQNPRALLQEALGRLGLTDPGKLSLLVSDFEPGPSFGGQMQKNWQESLSAFVNMEQLPYEELLSRVQSGRYSIAIAPLMAQGNSTVDFLSRFAGQETAVPEDSGEQSIAVLLDRARGRTDPQEAAADLLAVEQRLIDDSIVTPLFDAPSCFVLRDGVEGVRYHAVSHTVYFADAVIR